MIQHHARQLLAPLIFRDGIASAARAADMERSCLSKWLSGDRPTIREDSLERLLAHYGCSAKPIREGRTLVGYEFRIHPIDNRKRKE